MDIKLHNLPDVVRATIFRFRHAVLIWDDTERVCEAIQKVCESDGIEYIELTHDKIMSDGSLAGVSGLADRTTPTLVNLRSLTSAEAIRQSVGMMHLLDRDNRFGSHQYPETVFFMATGTKADDRCNDDLKLLRNHVAHFQMASPSGATNGTAGWNAQDVVYVTSRTHCQDRDHAEVHERFVIIMPQLPSPDGSPDYGTHEECGIDFCEKEDSCRAWDEVRILPANTKDEAVASVNGVLASCGETPDSATLRDAFKDFPLAWYVSECEMRPDKV